MEIEGELVEEQQQEQGEAEDAEDEEEVESEKEEEEKEKGEETPIMTPKSKDKENILIDEESETDEEEDIDAALKEAISKVTRAEEAKRSSLKIIASITVEQPTAKTLSLATAKKTPTKSPVLTPRASSKRKRAQLSGGVATMRALGELEPKKTKPTLPKVIKATITPPTNPTKSQKKKQSLLHHWVHQRSL